MEEKIYRREELVGKDVYDSSAHKVGKISDVGFSKDGEIILIISNGKFENKVPFLSSGIGDIILLKPDVKLKRDEIEPEQKTFPEIEKICPQCGKKCEVYSRVVGYLRPVSQWNDGKQSEFKIRKMFDSRVSIGD